MLKFDIRTSQKNPKTNKETQKKAKKKTHSDQWLAVELLEQINEKFVPLKKAYFVITVFLLTALLLK